MGTFNCHVITVVLFLIKQLHFVLSQIGQIFETKQAIQTVSYKTCPDKDCHVIPKCPLSTVRLQQFNRESARRNSEVCPLQIIRDLLISQSLASIEPSYKVISRVTVTSSLLSYRCVNSTLGELQERTITGESEEPVM